MEQDFISKIDKFIRGSFYFLFFLLPLIIWPDTFELFEFNKMWLVFMTTLFIFFLWGSKMIIQKKFEIRRTPLDIPLLLFFLSQLISTIISAEPHVSFWGYYSRFNGGLLSTVAYIFLYYAFATNMLGAEEEERSKNPILWLSVGTFTFILSALIPAVIPIIMIKMIFFIGLDALALFFFLKAISASNQVTKCLTIILLSGFAVVLWGLPSHFGTDPTCFVFRGTFDVSCWTADFQPTVRIFSTLGQPNWLGTFLAAIIPISAGFGIVKLSERGKSASISYLILTVLFFISLLYSRSQSAFLGLVVGMLIFLAFIIYKNLNEIKKVAKSDFSKYIIALIFLFGIFNFFIGAPIESINKLTTLNGIQNLISSHSSTTQPKIQPGLNTNQDIQVGGSESGDIRLIVWQGAIKIWQTHPLFGTGVETFAYSYYKVKPLAHNLTSEWDYLYNKAHNEYLNYLATTGIFGLGTYLLFAAFFAFYFLKAALKKSESETFPISAGIFAGFCAMLVSNFFGFSVVVINLFIFLFPIFFLGLENEKLVSHMFTIPNKASDHPHAKVFPPQVIAIVILGLIALYYEFFLIRFWSADREYALGYNLDHASQYAQAYQPLSKAVQDLPTEDLYKDELSINMATISLLFADQKQTDQAKQFGQQAKALSDYVVSKHPQNIVFYKTRARVLFALSEIDPTFLDQAIAEIEQARTLAPTDAKLAFNEGLFYQQKGDLDNAVKYVSQAIALKPNYADAYNSLALMYADLAKKNPRNAAIYKQKEKDSVEYILTHIDPNNKAAKDLLKTL